MNRPFRQHVSTLLALAAMTLPSLCMATAAAMPDMPGMQDVHRAHPPGGRHAHPAIGQLGDPAKVGRTVHVEMADSMRFSPHLIHVKRGETVKFVVSNSGKLRHEFVLGSAQDIQAHADMMPGHPQMAHTDGNQVSVAPGKTSVLIWQFGKAGAFDFACLEGGHFEAGMKGSIVVE
ncbi:MAG: hypothetical protein JWP38_1233 [Herbaspirillum sp.]|jgi:uncharacterized cupredoxin-like copper-binding protein|nr:hypothetical protein [Herbaspirillum sp.]